MDTLPQTLRPHTPGVPTPLATGERQRVRDSVFKPSHILPTMSVEQFGELEAQAAAQRAQREQEAAREQARVEAGRRSDDEDEDDAAKHKVVALGCESRSARQ